MLWWLAVNNITYFNVIWLLKNTATILLHTYWVQVKKLKIYWNKTQTGDCQLVQQVKSSSTGNSNNHFRGVGWLNKILFKRLMDISSCNVSRTSSPVFVELTLPLQCSDILLVNKYNGQNHTDKEIWIWLGNLISQLMKTELIYLINHPSCFSLLITAFCPLTETEKCIIFILPNFP